MKTRSVTAAITLLLATAPVHRAMAWSTASGSDVSTPAGTSRFTDPDDALEGTSGGGLALGYSPVAAGTGWHTAHTLIAAPFTCTGPASGCACANCQGNK